MAPLKDPVLLAKFLEALREWDCQGYIQWTRRADEWLRSNLPGHRQRSIGRAMYVHVLDGGEIDEVKESYEGYRDAHPFHYDFRIVIEGQHLYIETVFDAMAMGPTITVVNIKYA